MTKQENEYGHRANGVYVLSYAKQYITAFDPLY